MRIFDVLEEQSQKDESHPFERVDLDSSNMPEYLRYLDHLHTVYSHTSTTLSKRATNMEQRIDTKYQSVAIPRTRQSEERVGANPNYILFQSNYYPKTPAIMEDIFKHKAMIEKSTSYFQKSRIWLKKYEEFRDRYIDTHKDERRKKQQTISLKGKTLDLDTLNDRLPKMIGGIPSLENPALKGEDGYAGDPLGFPFTTKNEKTFLIISEALKRNGLPGFTVIYGSTFRKVNQRTGKVAQGQNLMAYAVDGKLCWRVYSVGGMSRNELIYANGKEVTNRFERMSVASRDLQEWFPEYFK